MATKSKQPRRKRNRLRGKLILVLGGVGLVAVVALFAYYAFNGGGDSKRSRAPVRQATVVVSGKQALVSTVDKDYAPRILTVPVGATVTWHNDGELPHTVTDDRGAFDSGAFSPGEDYVRTFDTPGTFYYYCTLHHAMLGTLTVAP